MIDLIKLDKVIAGLSRIEKDELQHINIERAKFCKEFIERVLMIDLPLKEICPFNYYHLNSDFEDFFDGRYKEDFGLFYICCVRFLKEYIMYLSRKKLSNVFVSSLWNSFEDDDLSLLDERCKRQANYIKKEMGVDILNFYFGDKGFEAFLDLSNNIKKAEFKSEEIKKNIINGEANLRKFLDDKQIQVNALSDKLEEQKTAFNFVGLSQGFESLLRKKRNNQAIVLCLLFFIGIFLFIPLFTYIELYQVRNQSSESFDWKIFLPFVSIELITLYLFRVVLIHYNSIKTQIMQLELRQTLCQFIQSYADYAKEIKEKDGASLEKFENLIFSSILSTPDKVPSTFDGLEQLSNLIKEFKK
ncbi:hypothetical protein ACQP31_10460 [Actinobacillus pleuropneumoniae]|nr:hypothetical protein [Actinobacillus pleuropneumoniae]EFL80605.1 hypothetical protein APP6_0028 [Actinobacillus pleuropneumoniae serovar 6 str. Femo]SUU55723.1 Uncharacterised protein [Actinobacillus pleuropneumoniae]